MQPNPNPSLCSASALRMPHPHCRAAPTLLPGGPTAAVHTCTGTPGKQAAVSPRTLALILGSGLLPRRSADLTAHEDGLYHISGDRHRAEGPTTRVPQRFSLGCQPQRVGACGFSTKLRWNTRTSPTSIRKKKSHVTRNVCCGRRKGALALGLPALRTNSLGHILTMEQPSVYAMKGLKRERQGSLVLMTDRTYSYSVRKICELF